MEKTTSPQSADVSANSLHRGVESAGAALHTTIDKVADPTRNAVDRLSSAAHQGVEKVTSQVADTADKIAEKARQTAQVPQQALQSSKSWVQEKPLQALGAALAVGFILGRLTSRSSTR